MAPPRDGYVALLGETARLAAIWPYLEEQRNGQRVIIFAADGFGSVVGNASSSIEQRFSYLHPADADARRARDDAIGRQQAFDVTYRLQAADQTYRVMRERGRSAVGIDGATRVFGVVSDVTRSHEQGEVLTRLSHAISEYVFTDIIRKDGSTDRVFSTPGLERLLGETPAGVRPADAWRRAVHPADQALVDEAMSSLRAGQPSVVAHRLRGFDDVERWVAVRLAVRSVREDGSLVVDGVAADISELKRAEAQATSLEEWLTRIVSDIDEVLYADEYGPDGSYHEVFLSPNWGRMVGADPDTPPPSWSDVLDPRDAALLDDFDRCLLRLEAAEATYRIRGVDGRIRHIRDRAFPHRRADGVVVVNGIMADVTAELEATQALAAARDHAERLSRIDPLTAAYNRRHFTEALSLEVARARSRGDGSGLLCIEVDSLKVVNDLRGHLAGDQVLCRLAERIRDAIGDGELLARVGGDEFMVLVSGVCDDEPLRAAAERVRGVIERTPVQLDTEPLPVTVSIGAAGMQRPEAHALLSLADRARLVAKNTGRNRVVLASEITPPLAASVEPVAVRLARTFAIAVGAREGMPERHLEDVADLAERVALELRLSSLEAIRCRLAGFLHDVGKVAVPDRILLKQGALDEAEWALMREHAALGARLVSQVPELAGAAAAVRGHHERYDGTGYPDRLAGEEIPIGARIIACVDAYSAMTTDRVYSRRVSAAAALVELERCAGTHFDPGVVLALVRILNRRRSAAA